MLVIRVIFKLAPFLPVVNMAEVKAILTSSSGKLPAPVSGTNKKRVGIAP